MVGIGASNPMVDYNKGSNLQKQWIEDGLGNMNTIVDNLPNSDHLTIMDLGCSQGKNSLFIFNQLLNVIAENKSDIVDNLKQISVFHEDLPNNDFKEFDNLIISDSLSYLCHPLIHSNDIRVHVDFISKSYYEPLIEQNMVDLCFCYTSLHWATQTYPLPYGIIYERSKVDSTTRQLYEQQAFNNLQEFLILRHEELKSGGLLSFNIVTKCSIESLINNTWVNFVNLKKLNDKSWDQVRFGAYHRSVEEVDRVLDHMMDQYNIIYKKAVNSVGYLTKLAYKAVAYNQIVSGLMQSSEPLGSQEEIEILVNEYIEFMEANPYNDNAIEATNEWIILQKI